MADIGLGWILSPDGPARPILPGEGAPPPSTEGGDGVGQELHQGGDEEQGRAAPLPGHPGGSADPGGQDPGGGQAARQGRPAGSARGDAQGAPPQEEEVVVTDQPRPTGGDRVVWPVAKRAFDEAFLGQVHKGLAQYDTVLMSMNGRDPYIDFLQEQADGLAYATQLYLEARTFVRLLVRSAEQLRATAARWTPATAVDALNLAYEIEQCLDKSGLSRSETPSPDASS